MVDSLISNIDVEELLKGSPCGVAIVWHTHNVPIFEIDLRCELEGLVFDLENEEVLLIYISSV